jgi:hypothetical protein
MREFKISFQYVKELQRSAGIRITSDANCYCYFGGWGPFVEKVYVISDDV